MQMLLAEAKGEKARSELHREVFARIKESKWDLNLNHLVSLCEPHIFQTQVILVP